jgi:hypothetical protein
MAAGLAVALGAIGTIRYLQTRDLAKPEQILARLPSEDASVLSIDFALLRRAGVFEMLTGSVVQEEPEYTTFVQKTGFNYQRDLDHAFLSFHPTGVYFLVEGRFDWKRLEAYAREQGGGCFNGLCRMQGSQPSRMISFFPLKRNLMALAVSPDAWAATRMNEPAKNARPIAIGSQPVWLSLAPATLKKADSFPAGTQLFAKAIGDAQSATVAIAPKDKALEAQLDVVCRNAPEASILVAQFQKVTSVLRELIAKEQRKPGPGDLATVLAAGVFRQDDTRVAGRWPIERAFLAELAGK